MYLTCACGCSPNFSRSLTPRMRGSKTHQKGREAQVTSSVRERSYTNKKEALVLKRQPRASLANFLSQYLTLQSVLAFLDVDQKNKRNKELCCLRSFPAGNGSQKAVLVRAPKRAPDFGFLRRKCKLTQFGVPNWSSDWGAISGAQLCRFFSSRSHICLHSWSLCSKVNKTLRSSVLLHPAGVPLKLKVVSGTRGNM